MLGKWSRFNFKDLNSFSADAQCNLCFVTGSYLVRKSLWDLCFMCFFFFVCDLAIMIIVLFYNYMQKVSVEHVIGFLLLVMGCPYVCVV